MKDLRFTKISMGNKHQVMRVCDAKGRVELISPHNFVQLDFHDVKKLYWWLDDWIYKERERCQNCNHERDGCQYHDASE